MIFKSLKDVVHGISKQIFIGPVAMKGYRYVIFTEGQVFLPIAGRRLETFSMDVSGILWKLFRLLHILEPPVKKVLYSPPASAFLTFSTKVYEIKKFKFAIGWNNFFLISEYSMKNASADSEFKSFFTGFFQIWRSLKSFETNTKPPLEKVWSCQSAKIEGCVCRSPSMTVFFNDFCLRPYNILSSGSLATLKALPEHQIL